MAKNLTHDMTLGKPTGLLLKFALPMLVGNLFQQLYNMVDSIVVGRYEGSNTLAAVGTTGPLNFFFFSLALGLAAGVSIVTAQYFGAKDEENVKKSFATAAYIVLGASLIMGIIGYILSEPMLRLLKTPENIIGQANIYMKIVCLGIVAIGAYNGMASILRALGDSLTPLIFLIVACLLNIVLDLLFVVGFGWSVMGVALATVISQVVAAVGCVLYALAKVKILRMPLKDFVPDKEIVKKCLRLGIPVALQNSFVSLSTMALQSIINSYGDTVMAAATAASRIEQLILQPGMSVGAAVAAYTGQNMGAGNIDRVKQGLRSAVRIILAFSLAMLPIIYFGGGFIMDWFTKDNDKLVMQIGIEALRVPCFFYSFVGLIFVTRNMLSGAGDVKIPMMMGFTEVVCRVLFANVLAGVIGYQGIWWATGLTWFFTSIVGCVRYLSGKWKYKSLIQAPTSVEG
ncbi:MATE family efflux transporter [Anaerocolumna cellulosilytica]|uniref:Probable multidrug resistance protein NorM n=1 Tax=Anaerocolumna cellulosilytica TaxID=433286 RepID=A0A6S6R9R0_9FIRM|nr:MATE family efflux transporter [Anaerocolumna cellulosilytica]MBB5196511.1 putative MATE family efflux protein [Anaerocolumna cellulosilytica]BCJ95611.1 MATE family efflux transporter [Anaerocolumna cellulosilytica]